MDTFSSLSSLILLFLVTLSSSFLISHQQPLLNSAEQHSLFEVLSSINSATPWRTLFPDDLCLSAPHGVVCDYFIEQQQPNSQNVSFSISEPLQTAHITELSFGYVSDYTPNPPCSSNSSLNPLLFTSFKYLRKLFFYKCFTETPVFLPNVSSSSFGENLEELVLVENPALFGSLSGIIGNFSNLRRLVLTGNGFDGNVPNGIGDLVSIEEVTLSRNQLTGEIPVSLAKLTKLKVLDLSQNHFDRNVPESIGDLRQMLKLDLSSNGFSGRIPESLINLQSLEFLDLSFNRFANFGIPLFLGEMPRLREVYLSGNLLGGHIPEIWEKLGGLSGIGFSNMGLVGKIPSSIGIYLKNLCYLRLDNNKLDGKVPAELGFLEFVSEINLENNNLSGKIPFSANFTTKIGEKLKLQGNSRLCMDCKNESNFGKLNPCSSKSEMTNPVPFKEGNPVSSSSPKPVLSSSYGFMIWVFFMYWLLVYLLQMG